MRRKKATELWNDLIKHLDETDAFSDWVRYYRELSSWTKSNASALAPELLEDPTLPFLVELDPALYVTKKHGLSKKLERSRMIGGETRSKISRDTMIVIIRETLLDLVTVWSSKSCPVSSSAMRLMLAIHGNERRLFRSCCDCPYDEWVDGGADGPRAERIIPATRADLLMYPGEEGDP